MIDSTPNENGRTGSQSQEGELVYEIGPDETPSAAVVRAVASLTDTAMLELEPLYDVVDSKHLDGLVEESNEKRSSIESSVTFDFNGCEVTVAQDTVHVHEHDRDTR